MKYLDHLANCALSLCSFNLAVANFSDTTGIIIWKDVNFIKVKSSSTTYKIVHRLEIQVLHSFQSYTDDYSLLYDEIFKQMRSPVADSAPGVDNQSLT